MITFDQNKCTGCCACQMACIDQRDLLALEQAPLRYVTEEVKQGKLVSKSIGCVHCGACMGACPMGCFSKSPEGYILLDNGDCIGCRSCLDACPMQVISFHPVTGKAMKCDGCLGRIREGLVPACVHTCPTGALTFSPDTL